MVIHGYNMFQTGLSNDKMVIAGYFNGIYTFHKWGDLLVL